MALTEVPAKVFAPSPPRKRENKLWGMTVSDRKPGTHQDGHPPKSLLVMIDEIMFSQSSHMTVLRWFRYLCSESVTILKLEREDGFKCKGVDFGIDVATNFSQDTQIVCDGVAGAEGDFGEFGGAVCVEATVANGGTYFFRQAHVAHQDPTITVVAFGTPV